MNKSWTVTSDLLRLRLESAIETPLPPSPKTGAFPPPITIEKLPVLAPSDDDIFIHSTPRPRTSWADDEEAEISDGELALFRAETEALKKGLAKQVAKHEPLSSKVDRTSNNKPREDQTAKKAKLDTPTVSPFSILAAGSINDNKSQETASLYPSVTPSSPPSSTSSCEIPLLLSGLDRSQDMFPLAISRIRNSPGTLAEQEDPPERVPLSRNTPKMPTIPEDAAGEAAEEEEDEPSESVEATKDDKSEQPPDSKQPQKQRRQKKTSTKKCTKKKSNKKKSNKKKSNKKKSNKKKKGKRA
ncbi:hypothetical protein MKZ38_009593 [Zalerion maritima]|uniref:Uncharacterized protein n=1 Tax=Zalerion maritima TaxID=339359 RepID=A0AAD5WSY3_9PEZI|nr:hypothetical protein MKZ38_009593 [Zalerion maritima]